MNLRILKKQPKVIVLAKSDCCTELKLNGSVNVNETLFYQEENDFRADLALFQRSVRIFIHNELSNELLIGDIKKKDFSFVIFNDLNDSCILRLISESHLLGGSYV